MAVGVAAIRPVSLFYSYSHCDERFRRRLETHLSVLRRRGLIVEWHDRKIGAGSDWRGEIDNNLATADIVLLLVSPDFIDSDYCWDEEMTKALQRHERGEARVIPIILRPCRWSNTPFAKLGVVPRDGRPVTGWQDRDSALDDVAEAIERIIEDLQRGRAVEEANRKAEEEERRRREQEAAEARRRAEEEEQRRREQEAAEARRRVEEEERRRREQEAAEARRRVEEEERRRREQEAAEARRRAGTGAGLRDQERQPAEGKPARARHREKEEQQKAFLRRWLARGAVVSLVCGVIGILVNEYQTAPPVVEDKPAPPVVDMPRVEAEPGRAPGDTFVDCEICPKMVVLQGGTFMMGSPESEKGRDNDEGPQRSVTIKPFAIGKYEVTFDEWDACVRDGSCGYRPDDNGWGRGSRPVINVSWDDSQAYVSWLAKKTNEAYRLPTEAEWEYAARAGTKTPYSFGEVIATDEANYDRNDVCDRGGTDRCQTVPVGSLPSKSWGLHEMHGNVWEWVEDCYHDSYRGAPQDGAAWTANQCFSRVVRGGSWYSPRSGDLRLANRARYEPDKRRPDLGFRVSKTLDED